LTAVVLSSSFPKFSVPSKDEGFDEVNYQWGKGSKSEEYLKKWILERKLTTRIEDIQPSAWFTTQYQKWSNAVRAWQGKIPEYRALLARKASEKAAREAKKKAAAEKKAAEERKAAEEKKEGEDKETEGEKKEEEKKEDTKMDVDEEKEEEEEEPLDFEAIDVFGTEDILNVGQSAPLFKEFQPEDWAMMALRFELHLLAHSFRRDVEDPERLGIHEDHLGFYYQRYFKKHLNPKDYGVDALWEVVDLANDCVFFTPQKVLESQLAGETETFAAFVKVTEEARRYRTLRLALGEEGAELKLSQGALQLQHRSQPNNQKNKWNNKQNQGAPQQHQKGEWRQPGAQKGGDWHQKGQQKGDWQQKGSWQQPGPQKGDWQQKGQQKGDWQQHGQQKSDWQQKGQQKGDWQQKGQQKGDWHQQQGYGKAPKGKDGGGKGGYGYQPYGGKGGKASGKGGWKGGKY